MLDLPSDTSIVRCVDTNLAFLKEHPCHFRCGVYLICTQGEALVSTGVEQYVFDEQTELIFLTGTLMELFHASEDFKATALIFPNDVFLKAMLPIDTPYFNYTHEHPCYRHTKDERSQKTWREIRLWMDVAKMLFDGLQRPFRQQQEHNYLQSLLMWLFNTIPDKLPPGNQYSRKQIICHRFMQLVRESSMKQHQVAFYADKLCISPRYLHQVTVEYLGGKTPKQLIDEQLVAEIKVLLSSSDFSVAEIAAQLGFADQSYLTRFFKKNAGLSPKAFRQQKV